MKTYRFAPPAYPAISAVTSSDRLKDFARRAGDETPEGRVFLLDRSGTRAVVRLPESVIVDPRNWRDDTFSASSEQLDITVLAVSPEAAGKALAMSEESNYPMGAGEHLWLRLPRALMLAPENWKEV